MGSLTDAVIRKARPGRYSDGGGLLLTVRDGGSRFWTLRIMRDGKRRDIGLGSYPAVTLATARAQAAALRQSVKAGADPVAEKAKAKAERIAGAALAGERTFEAVARQCHAARAPEYRNAKHRAQWIATLEAYAFPRLGALPIAEVTAPLALDALEPIWTAKPETARRVRQRIETVLTFAHARGWRERAPDLKAHARHGLAPQRGDKGHFEAVPYADAAAYWAALQAAPESIGRLALAFTILTAARSGETRGATWGEIDLQAGLWSIPGERMKAGKPHVVPLSAPALAILERMQAARAHAGAAALVFPGAGGRPLSDMTMGKAHKLLAPGTTVHGWRSTFRDWAGETTGFPPDLCEAALAHAFGSKVQRAYQRGSMLDRRRELMDAWAAYLAPPAACNVTPIGEARRSVRSV